MLNFASKQKLTKVHPDLARVFLLAASRHQGPFQLIVVEGVRTLERQKQLVAAGASRTLKSRHLMGRDGYAKALDVGFLLDGKYRGDWPPYIAFSKLMKAAAKELRIPVEWGGDWKSFKDGPHYQLNAKVYP